LRSIFTCKLEMIGPNYIFFRIYLLLYIYACTQI
jgi:hypothetical protein